MYEVGISQFSVLISSAKQNKLFNSNTNFCNFKKESNPDVQSFNISHLIQIPDFHCAIMSTAEKLMSSLPESHTLAEKKAVSVQEQDIIQTKIQEITVTHRYCIFVTFECVNMVK